MEVFLARQPIFDRASEVFAYELLFRSGADNHFPDVDPDAATTRVINYLTDSFKLDVLTGPRRAFVNITRRILVHELYTLLPADRVVIELLETVEPDTEVIEACQRLRQRGYALALDDYIDGPDYGPLLELTTYLKVDFVETKADERARLARTYRSQLQLLAEKVETQEEVEEARKLGYRYFQGYFFCRPKVLSGREIPLRKLLCLEFLKEVAKPELRYRALEEIVRRDTYLAVKLLRMVNSAAFANRNRPVTGVREALIWLGRRALQRWAAMLAVTEMNDDKPRELMVTSLVRGRFCELLGESRSADAHALFLVGALSMLDALFDRPLAEAVAELGLSDEICAGILDDASALGRYRRLVVAHEAGDWTLLAELAAELQVPPETVEGAYTQALSWATDALPG